MDVKRRITTALLSVLLLAAGSCPAGAQNDTLRNKDLYRVWITPVNDSGVVRGVLYAVGDSGLWLSGSYQKEVYLSNTFSLREVKAPEIMLIRLRRNHAVGRGAGWGALAGAATGVIVGAIVSASYSDCKGYECIGTAPGPMMTGMGMLLGGVGSIAGVIISSVRIKIPINGNRDIYRKNKARLRGYALKKHGVKQDHGR